MENVYYDQQWSNVNRTDVIDDANTIPLASNEQYGNAYEQQDIVPAQQHLQAPMQSDEYYTVSPGENYYTDYSVDQPYQSYQVDDGEAMAITATAMAVSANTGGIDASAELVVAADTSSAQEPFNQIGEAVEAEATIQQQIPGVDAMQMERKIERQTRPNRVPNYLQSDTDDSQIGYIDPNNANSATYPDSDFEFSINS